MRLNNQEFQQKKQVILFLYDYACQVCGLIDTSNHVHHVNKNPCDHDTFNLVPLCWSCHNKVHKNLNFVAPDPSHSLRVSLDKLNSFF